MTTTRQFYRLVPLDMPTHWRPRLRDRRRGKAPRLIITERALARAMDLMLPAEEVHTEVGGHAFIKHVEGTRDYWVMDDDMLITPQTVAGGMLFRSGRDEARVMDWARSIGRKAELRLKWHIHGGGPKAHVYYSDRDQRDMDRTALMGWYIHVVMGYGAQIAGQLQTYGINGTRTSMEVLLAIPTTETALATARQDFGQYVTIALPEEDAPTGPINVKEEVR